ARLKSGALRVTLLVEPDSEVRGLDQRSPCLKPGIAAEVDDILRLPMRGRHVPEVVAARELAFESHRELEGRGIVARGAGPSDGVADEIRASVEEHVAVGV